MPTGVYYRTLTCRSNLSQSLSGRQRSLESRLKQSKSILGHPGYMTGKKMSEESRLKMRNSAKRLVESGLHHLLNSDKLSEYPKEWTKELRNLIRSRDNYECKLCNKTQDENKQLLVVHHINYNKTDCSKENLISLCRKCHAKTNYKRKKFLKAFQISICIKQLGMMTTIKNSFGLTVDALISML